MDSSRIPRRVLEWDYKRRASGWLGDLLEVCKMCEIPIPDETRFIYDLEPVKRKMIVKSREEWKSAAEDMSKLCTYVVVKDFTEVGTLVKSNLQRNHRSLIARFLCGILPLEIETGRYTRTKRELRFCKICNEQVVEDETHFLLECPRLTKVQFEKLKSILRKSRETINMSNTEKIQWLLEKEQIKDFGEALAALYQARQDVLYNKK